MILVKGGDPKLFEQAIFILRDDAVGREGVTEDALLRQANALLRSREKGRGNGSFGFLCALGGALFTAIIWGISMIF